MEAEVASVKRAIKQSMSVQQLDELKCMKRVLRRLEFCTKEEVIELKGRVACEVSSGDPLLLTEMIFNGVFNDLTREPCNAIVLTTMSAPYRPAACPTSTSTCRATPGQHHLTPCRPTQPTNALPFSARLSFKRRPMPPVSWARSSLGPCE